MFQKIVDTSDLMVTPRLWTISIKEMLLFSLRLVPFDGFTIKKLSNGA